MANPISNNNLSPLGSNNANKSNNDKEKGPGGLPVQASEVAAGRHDDAVSVSRAAEVLNQQSEVREVGSIKSTEQAFETAQKIRALFEGNSGQAQAAQAKNVSSELLGLLHAG